MDLSKAKGIAIMEALCASILISAILIGLGLFSTKIVPALVKRSQKTTAMAIAASTLEGVRGKTYYAVPLTSGAFVNPNVCDCANVVWGNLPVMEEVNGKTTYNIQSCVNRTDEVGSAYCPSAMESGLKKLVVRVSWMESGTPNEYLLESSIASKEQVRLASISTGTAVISGRLSASEDAALPMKDIGVVWRDDQGVAVNTVWSVAQGTYAVSDLAAGTYTIAPVLELGWGSIPVSRTVTLTAGEQLGNQDFTISRVKTIIPVTGPAGSFALVMQKDLTPSGSSPPEINQKSATSVVPVQRTAYTGTLGDNNSLFLVVSPDAMYELTCWMYDADQKTFQRGATVPVANGDYIPPQSVTSSVACAMSGS